MPATKTRTLGDVLVSAIQRAPRQEFSKLALADLLEENRLAAEANVLRWCAKTRRWPQRRAWIHRSVTWQWWHYTARKSQRAWINGFYSGYRIQPWAILPWEMALNWPWGQLWSANTWLEALRLLVVPLRISNILDGENR